MKAILRSSSFVFLLITSLPSAVCGQKIDSTWIGTADGVIRDSVHNYVLPSATAAIYKVTDSSLFGYRLTNNFGEFHFNDLPVGISLRIVVSYIGYKSFSRTFIISIEKKGIDLKEIDLERNENTMDEVVVKLPPPVRMNGDTLEFNASAFALDKNAVAEDLLKRLPGVIVWGDGIITVNGKQIKQLLVEGKPFFGENPQIATQNLPKNAIDIIQVYQEQVDPNNPLDSLSTINIKLKANKKTGNFGKIAAGYGSGKQYQVDADLNFFSSQTQFGIAGASNNINKVASDIYTLMRNSTYKGVGARVEYQPDFSMPGVNQPSSGGFIFQHDFIPDPSSYKQDRLAANSFLNNNINKTIRNTQTTTSIGNDSTLIQNNSNSSRTNNTGFGFESQYNKQKDNNSFHIAIILSANKSNEQNSQQNEVYGPGKNLLSGDSVQNDSNTVAKSFSLQTEYSHKADLGMGDRHLRDWDIAYSFKIGNGNNNSFLFTNFTSSLNPSQGLYYNRKYQNSPGNIDQTLSMTVGDLSPVVFGENRFMSNYKIEAKNDLIFEMQNQNNLIEDKDTSNGSYFINPYLTNKSKNNIINEMPDLNISRTIIDLLANRYQKILLFNLDTRVQFYSQNNSSEHAFQNFTHNYQNFIPSASIAFNNSHFSDHLENYELKFSVTSDYPGADQLVPLVDSANIYYIREGNAGLRPSDKKQLTFTFRHDGYQSKNTFNYGFTGSAGITKNYFADSVTVDSTGRYFYYTINLNGNRYLNTNGFLNKAFRFKDQQIQFSLRSTFGLSRNPGYIKYVTNSTAVLNISYTINNSDTVSIYYVYKNIIALNISQGLSFYHSKQNGISTTEFRNNLIYTKLGIGLNLTKKFTVSSNVSYNSTASSGSPSVKFTIWNADAAYRFMEANNLELKFSALDMLHQNTGILNYGNNYSITHGSVNVLQQYFMVTLSYFPRKFGKNK
jgi:hypothetical protein